MPKVNTDWAKEQLTENKTKKVVGDSVLKLLDAWSQIKDTTDQNTKEIVDIFSKLSLGHALVKDNKEDTWVPVQAGFVKVADQIRIRFDAFDGEKGEALNGRQGKIVGLRSGDIIIKSNDGKSPVLDGIHFKAENLEKLVY